MILGTGNRRSSFSYVWYCVYYMLFGEDDVKRIMVSCLSLLLLVLFRSVSGKSYFFYMCTG